MIIPLIEQKQMMHDPRPSRDTPAPLPTRAPLLDLRHEPTASLPADRRRHPEEYEDIWEQHFMNHLAREICEGDSECRARQRYEQPEEEGRRRQAESRSKNRKKGMSKYKAYAVKMKIPSYHELTRPRRDGFKGQTVEFKPRPDPRAFNQPLRGIYQPHSLSRMEEVFRANIRDIAIANIFESSNGNIFKKRPAKGNKNAVIRKRSIKTTDKRREEEEAKVSVNKFLKTSTSPKIGKKCVISLDQSSLEPAEATSTCFKQPKKPETCKSKKGFSFVKTPMKSPQKEREAGIGSREGREGLDSTSKLLEKVDRAIHFKKKEKAESPAKSALREHTSQKYEKTMRMELVAQASKTIIRTIYTSKDVIRNKSNLAKEAREAQQRRESGSQKVFVFNSEDNYIRRMLVQAGWINNHDHRSHFYHLKWVFKPDSIDYSLKPDQFVNHVKNSHELTSKHYLNKNLKAYLSSWSTLYSVYPHSYDFAKPAEKQDFYAHFKKEIMMNLLQNVYEYMLSSRTQKVQSFTHFYTSLLEENGSYRCYEAEASSPLRKKHFRKIDMEDYRQYDTAFLVHMNLLIVALKYWRGLRKAESLDLDDQQHFLAFREKEFDENLSSLERYSKMRVGYSPDCEISNSFESEFYATPSEIAIARVVKEYVYFQRQLGRQWRVFGRGNIWIVKPCSASRGTGIYLANDCAEILTDTRGIQSKIVQRYIQRPLILQDGLARGRKFDLRQWVLLRSVQPLQIYMFSHCYLRVCSEQFVISNISNLKGHLTNYSFNKRHFQQPAESVIDQDAFQAMLMQERRVSFVDTVRPKIKDIIIRSIKSTQHLISDCGNACFSLLGYDILLDDDCEPWLLQVNMSPACEERTDWLRTYLDVMGRDLLKIVLPDSYISNPVKPSGRGSELPARKHWQEDCDQLQLKKMKTEISQSNGQNEEPTSYVNAIFDLNPSKVQLEQLDSEVILDGNSASGSEESGERVNFEDFVTENGLELEEAEEGQEGQEGIIQQQEKGDGADNAVPSSPLLDAKFANLELYLDDPRDKLLLASPNKLIPPSPLTPSPQLSPSKPNPSQLSLMKLESELGWEKICFEDYSGGRKDGETHFELTGVRITHSHLHEIDRAIENAEAERETVTESCINVQTAIRQYLTAKQAQRKAQIEKAGLKLNVAHLAKNEFRQSKSALYNHEEKAWNFDRNTGTQSKLERPITARNCSNPVSGKYRGGDSFREKIRSIAMQAASRQSCTQQGFRGRWREQSITDPASPPPAGGLK